MLTRALSLPGNQSNLAHLGIVGQLDGSSFSPEPKKVETSTPTGMGRAMGGGSGLGLHGAANIAPPAAPFGSFGGEKLLSLQNQPL
jgi:hypothetical protein